MKLPLDSYALRARFLPSILVVAPAVATLASWITIEPPAWKLLTSVGVLAATGVLLSHLARDLGQRKQAQLWSGWGGAPSVRYLRHRDRTLNATSRERYHTRLGALIPGITLPTAYDERKWPVEADGIYASCVDWLREKTRDRSRFHLLFEENVSYGFRRNLWAMKPAGVALAVIGMLATSVRLVWELQASRPLSPEAVAGLIISVVLLVLWLVRIRSVWVAHAADSYARALLAACEEM